MLKVELLQYTPEAEKLVAASAKLCYSNSGIDNIMEDLKPDKTQKFLNMLMEIGHESPTEHVCYTFGIEGVSRSLLAQITRHRIASYSVKSQRYVREAQFEYIVPPEIECISEAKEVFLEAMRKDQKDYNTLVDILSNKHYNAFKSEGKDDKDARGLAEKKAIEDARYLLPNACETKMIITMNARSLYNFFNHRCCERAQWEIRELAIEMLKIVRKVSPILFKSAGPKCILGHCSEGRMSCGRLKEKRIFFRSLEL